PGGGRGAAGARSGWAGRPARRSPPGDAARAGRRAGMGMALWQWTCHERAGPRERSPEHSRDALRSGLLMELRQLRYVVAVAEERNFTRAAARAHVAQPAISQQIAQIERELGSALFERSSRGVALTPAGAAFLPPPRAALAAPPAGSHAVVPRG